MNCIMEAPTRHLFCLTLATFKKIDGKFVLNSVRDYQPTEVLGNSIGVLRIGQSECTAWVISTPKQLTIGMQQVLCIVCTAGHSLINPFAPTIKKKVKFTFAQDNIEISAAFATGLAYDAFPIYCPSNVEADDFETDPISKNKFSLPHDIALFAVLKKATYDEVVCFDIDVQPLSFEENNTTELSVLGYPLVVEESVEALVVPDKKQLGLETAEIEKAFKGNRSLVISPGVPLQKSTEDTLIAITNPAAPRLSGSPLIFQSQVIGLLVGSVPLLSHIHSFAISVLAKTSIEKALQYINDNNLHAKFLPRIFDWENLEPSAKTDRINENTRNRIRGCSEIIFNEAYRDYYLDSPEAPRYNICLAASSPYFKSAVLLAKSLERLYRHFDSIEEFLGDIITTSVFTLNKTELGWEYLTATLDSDFDQIYNSNLLYLREDTEEDSRKILEARTQYHSFRVNFLNLRTDMERKGSDNTAVQQLRVHPTSSLTYHFKIRAYFFLSSITFDIKASILEKILAEMNLHLKFRNFEITNNQKNSQASFKHKIFLGLDDDESAELLVNRRINLDTIGQLTFIPTKMFREFILAKRLNVNMKEIEFNIAYSTNFGERILITGKSVKLGCWDINRGIQLKYIKENLFGVKITLEEFPDEYKYVVVQGNSFRWEGGSNHILRSYQSIVNDCWQL